MSGERFTLRLSAVLNITSSFLFSAQDVLATLFPLMVMKQVGVASEIEFKWRNNM